jgi:CRP-like cAMP-binding protein
MAITPHLIGPYERLILLKALSSFGDVPAPALAALAGQATERHLAAGATLVDIYHRWDAVHILVEGAVTVSESGRPPSTVGPREAIGLLEVLASVKGGVQARATVETVTLEIGATTLFSILEDHRQMTFGMVQELARSLVASAVEGTIWSGQPVQEIDPGRIDLVDRIRLLKRTDLFARTRVFSLGEIASHFDERRLDVGTVLWREGDPASWLMVLLDGEVEASSRGGLGQSYGPGTAPGALDAIAGTPRSYAAKAVTPVTALRLSADRLFDALEDDFSMAEDLLAALATGLRRRRQD